MLRSHAAFIRKPATPGVVAVATTKCEIFILICGRFSGIAVQVACSATLRQLRCWRRPRTGCVRNSRIGGRRRRDPPGRQRHPEIATGDRGQRHVADRAMNGAAAVSAGRRTAGESCD